MSIKKYALGLFSMKGDYKIKRLLKIYNRIKSGPITIDSLKEWIAQHDISVSDRTLYRYLTEIESFLLPEGEKMVVVKGEKNKKTWKIEFSKSQKGLTEFDLNTYFLLKNYAPLSLISSRRKSLQKLQTAFYQLQSKSSFERYSAVSDSLLIATHFHEQPFTDGFNTILQECIWAVQNQRKLKILEIKDDYTSRSPLIKTPLIMYPLQLIYHRGCIFLAGLTEALYPLVMGISQLYKYELTNELFDGSNYLPKLEQELTMRFGISENVNAEVYDIEIEFSAFTGSFVSKHHWHHSQQITILDNGNYLMSLRSGINRELVGWIFQWMSNARVIKPQLLKDLVTQKLKDIEDIYLKDNPLESNNSYLPMSQP